MGWLAREIFSLLRRAAGRISELCLFLGFLDLVGVFPGFFAMMSVRETQAVSVLLMIAVSGLFDIYEITIAATNGISSCSDDEPELPLG